MKIVFVVNPRSGKRKNRERLAPLIAQRMAARGADYEILFTERKGHATELAAAAAARYPEVRVVSCGGDGTISECAAGLVGKPNAALAAYPSGGGNDFIKSIGERDLFTLDAILDGEVVCIDTLTVNGVCCLNLASVGVDADVAGAMERFRRLPFLRGPIAYDLALVERLFKPMGRAMRVEIDGEARDGIFLLAAAGNGRVYGGGYAATPMACLNDGLIDVVTVDKIPLLRIAHVLSLYKKGQHIVGDEVIPKLRDCLHYIRARHIRVESDTEFIVNNDGEILSADVMDVEVVPRSLNFVIPPGCKGSALLAK